MKVMVADKIAADGIKKLKDGGFEVLSVWDETKEKLPELIKDCDALIVRSATKATKELIDAAPNLKVIGRAGVGLDNVDAAHAKTKNIKVVNTPGATSISVAELAVGLTLAVSRKVAFSDRGTRKGEWPKNDNPLKNAPHTAESLLKSEWSHAYSREQAAYPVKSLRKQKYWAPVGRVDNVWGDRNLFCSCVPVSEYAG